MIQFWGIIHQMDRYIVDKIISIHIINNGAATPLPSFERESDT